jgi:hypothetical protein
VVTDPFNQLVIQTQCAMVLRVLANPDGILEESGTTTPAVLDASVSTGALYLTDAERALLTAMGRLQRRGVLDPAEVVRGLPRCVVPAVTTDTWTPGDRRSDRRRRPTLRGTDDDVHLHDHRRRGRPSTRTR